MGASALFGGKPATPAPQFVAAEVWQVARALIEGSEYLEENTGRSPNRWTCRLCDEWEPYDWKTHSSRPITHQPGCAALVARDLLTGAPDG